MKTINTDSLVSKDLVGAIATSRTGNTLIIYYTEDVVPETPPENPKDVYKYEVRKELQLFLDTPALALDYKNIDDACSWATSKHEVFGPEGIAFVAWRDSVWTTVYKQEEAAQPAGISWEDLVPTLPVFPGVPSRKPWWDVIVAPFRTT